MNMGKRIWTCEARGYLHQLEVFTPLGGSVEGVGTGSSQEEACRNAKRNATQRAPRGTYARHLRCKGCHK